MRICILHFDSSFPKLRSSLLEIAFDFADQLFRPWHQLNKLKMQNKSTKYMTPKY